MIAAKVARCIGVAAAAGAATAGSPWGWAPAIGRCSPIIARFIDATSTQARAVSRVRSSYAQYRQPTSITTVSSATPGCPMDPSEAPCGTAADTASSAAVAGLIAGLWIPYLAAVTCAALIAYFVIAIGMHVAARDLGRNLFVNATGMLAICIAVPVLAFWG